MGLDEITIDYEPSEASPDIVHITLKLPQNSCKSNRYNRNFY